MAEAQSSDSNGDIRVACSRSFHCFSLFIFEEDWLLNELCGLKRCSIWAKRPDREIYHLPHDFPIFETPNSTSKLLSLNSEAPHLEGSLARQDRLCPMVYLLGSLDHWRHGASVLIHTGGLANGSTGAYY